jgi:hypothetical protein
LKVVEIATELLTTTETKRRSEKELTHLFTFALKDSGQAIGNLWVANLLWLLAMRQPSHRLNNPNYENVECGIRR